MVHVAKEECVFLSVFGYLLVYIGGGALLLTIHKCVWVFFCVCTVSVGVGGLSMRECNDMCVRARRSIYKKLV